MNNEIEQVILVKLLNQIDGDLRLYLNASGKLIFPHQELNEDFDSKFITLSNYISSSQQILNDISAWGENQLLGEKIYSSDLRSHAQNVIRVFMEDNDNTIQIINSLDDIRPVKVNIKLFSCILNKLLILIIKYCFRNEKIIISAVLNENTVIVEISGISSIAYEMLGESCLNNTYCKDQYDALQDGGVLKLTYDILGFYGGNLWSDYRGKDNSKICFSIPYK